MMSNNYDNWERLVKAVLLREELRQIAMCPSMDSSCVTSASSSFDFNSTSPISDSFLFSRSFEFPVVHSGAIHNPKDQDITSKFKQKIVVRVSMIDGKSRIKAMKTAVGLDTVESASIMGNEKDQVVVVGDGIDAVLLMRLLRKNVAHAELVSVAMVKKEEAAPAHPRLPRNRRWFGAMYHNLIIIVRMATTFL